MAAQKQSTSNQKIKMQHMSTATPGSISKPPSYLPTKRNQQFIGRLEFLHEIRKNESAAIAKTPIISLYGEKGVGKTEIANKVAHDIRDNNSESSVLWASATNLETFKHSYGKIAKSLGIQRSKEPDFDVLNAVKDHLDASEGRWLLILDGADDETLWSPSASASLTRYLPETCQFGLVLVTTTNGSIAKQLAESTGKGLALPVNGMEEHDAIKLFKSRFDKSTAPATTDKDIRLLVARLGFFPLAIVQAAAHLGTNKMTIDEYLAKYSEVEGQFTNDETYTTIASSCLENTSRLTWLISNRQIDSENPVAGRLLAIMAILSTERNPKGIPAYQLPVETVEHLSQLETTTRHRNALRLLEDLRFIERIDRRVPGGCSCPDCGQRRLVEYYKVDQRVADATLKILLTKSEDEVYHLTKVLAVAILNSSHSPFPTDSCDTGPETSESGSVPLSTLNASEPTEATVQMFFAWFQVKKFFYSTRPVEIHTWLREVRGSLHNQNERTQHLDDLNTILLGSHEARLRIHAIQVSGGLAKLFTGLAPAAGQVDGRLTAEGLEEIGAGMRYFGESFIGHKSKKACSMLIDIVGKLSDLKDFSSDLAMLASCTVPSLVKYLAVHFGYLLPTLASSPFWIAASPVFAAIGTGISIVGGGFLAWKVLMQIFAGWRKLQEWRARRRSRNRGSEEVEMRVLFGPGVKLKTC